MVNIVFWSGSKCKQATYSDGESAGVLAALWPLAEGTFVSQLLTGLPADEVSSVAHLYHLLLTALPVLARSCGTSKEQEEPRFVNALVSNAIHDSLKM